MTWKFAVDFICGLPFYSFHAFLHMDVHNHIIVNVKSLLFVIVICEFCRETNGLKTNYTIIQLR